MKIKKNLLFLHISLQGKKLLGVKLCRNPFPSQVQLLCTNQTCLLRFLVSRWSFNLFFQFLVSVLSVQIKSFVQGIFPHSMLIKQAKQFQGFLPSCLYGPSLLAFLSIKIEDFKPDIQIWFLYRNKSFLLCQKKQNKQQKSQVFCAV